MLVKNTYTHVKRSFWWCRSEHHRLFFLLIRKKKFLNLKLISQVAIHKSVCSTLKGSSTFTFLKVFFSNQRKTRESRKLPFHSCYLTFERTPFDAVSHHFNLRDWELELHSTKVMSFAIRKIDFIIKFQNLFINNSVRVKFFVPFNVVHGCLKQITVKHAKSGGQYREYIMSLVFQRF